VIAQATPSDSPSDPDVIRALAYASNNALLVCLAVHNAALSCKLKSKQPKRYVLFLPSFLSSVESGGVGGCDPDANLCG